MTEQTATETREDLRGLGGWLVLVAIGLVVGCFRVVAQVWTTYLPIFRDGTWEALTTPGAEAYHELWAPLLLLEVLLAFIQTVAIVVLLVLFFRRSRLFPEGYKILLVAVLVWIVLDAWLVTLVLPNEPIFDPATAAEFSRSLVGCLIWVPYMIKSRRVALTFVE